MPTYDYRCPKCGHEYMQVQKITDETRAKCPECATAGERVISGGAGLIFKGSGFYITDYARAGDKAKGTQETGKADGETGSGPAGTKSESPKEPSKTVKPSKSKGADS